MGFFNVPYNVKTYIRYIRLIKVRIMMHSVPPCLMLARQKEAKINNMESSPRVFHKNTSISRQKASVYAR